ncbi:hypothetical protein BDW74DRAFT_145757 [Aspergillus multicolor]|uniref:uncharacterized protein n=1 Tax=Aspergillus multicolor TaxID=41759 RepID=UPI003CCDD993
MRPEFSGHEDYDPEPSISFTSLGLLVLDEIRFPGHVPLTDVLGGSGVYGVLLAKNILLDKRLIFWKPH